jgi:[protein-PII] uridylyltransferase
MTNTAFRRDPYDEKVFLPFAKEVETSEVLRMLLVLTIADIAAVGPGVLTKWKESLLVQLYLHTLPTLSGEQEKTVGPEFLKHLAMEVAHEFTDPAIGGLDWIESQLSQFPLRYLHGISPKRIAAHLGAVGRLKPGDVLVEETFNEELGMSEYTVITHDNLTPGLFSKMAGAMAAEGLEILDAQIITRDDGIVVNTFQASDPDYVGVPPEDRRASVAETIIRVLKGEEALEELIRRNTRLSDVRRLPATHHATEVVIDNGVHDRFTIIDVFADDTQGLLYVITRAIFELGLSVHAARISTSLDDDIEQSLRRVGRHQVVDVFYVTDRNGGKVEDHIRLEAIRSSIKRDIDQFMGQPVDTSETVSAGSSL